MKRTKTILFLSMLLICLLATCACAGNIEDTAGSADKITDTNMTDMEVTEVTTAELDVHKEAYEAAIRALRVLLEESYSYHELKSEELYVRWEPSLPSVNYPLVAKQAELESLYRAFSSFDNYKQAEEILGRFSVIEKGSVTVTMTWIGEDGKEVGAYNYDNVILDEQGRRIWKGYNYLNNGGVFFVYGEDGNLMRAGNILYKYDESGRLVESRELDSDLSNYMIATYTYDEHGRCIEDISRYKTAVNVTQTYTYDERGRIESMHYVSAGMGFKSSRDFSYTYTYDETGACLLMRRYSAELASELDMLEIYSQDGRLISSLDHRDILNGQQCYEVRECLYESGYPVRIYLANGYVLMFEYAPAYLFDDAGLMLLGD